MPDDNQLTGLARVMGAPGGKELKGPYPGLRPFEAEESCVFFGRDAQISDVLDKLRENQFAAVIGGSGCGKSSLVRAGVMRDLRSYAIAGTSSTWKPVIFNPGSRPIANLAEELEKTLDETRLEKKFGRRDKSQRVSGIEKLLLSEKWPLSKFLEDYQLFLAFDDDPRLAYLGEQANLLVVVDQFEEIFRDETIAHPHTAKLVQLLINQYEQRHPRVFVILTMRSEYIDRCAAYIELSDMLNEVMYVTRRLRRDELEEVIVRPAREVCSASMPVGEETSLPRDWPFDPIVKARLLREVDDMIADSDHLALVEHLLFRLWQVVAPRWNARDPGSFLITTSDLENAVGSARADEPSLLRRCLAHHADQCYRALSEEKRAIAEQIFKLLADLYDKEGYKRRFTSVDEILTHVGASNDNQEFRQKVTSIIDAFAASNYVRTRAAQGVQSAAGDIDVSHECFIRKWPRFVSWLKEEKEASEVYCDLVNQYVQRAGKPQGSQPSLVKRVFGWYFARLEEKTRLKALQYNIADRGSNWARRYRGIVGRRLNRDINDEDHANAIAFYKRSNKLRRLDHTSAFVIALFLCFGAYYLFVEAQTSRLKGLEADAFKPFAIASLVQGGLEELPESAGPARLWQAAVALKALQHLEFQAGEWETGERGLQFEVNRRLAQSSADQAARRIIRSAVWPDVAPSPQEMLPAATPKTFGELKEGSLEKDCMLKVLDMPADDSRFYRGPQLSRDVYPFVISLPPQAQSIKVVFGFGENQTCRFDSERILNGTELYVSPSFGLLASLFEDPNTGRKQYGFYRMRWYSFGAEGKWRGIHYPVGRLERARGGEVMFAGADRVCLAGECFRANWLDTAVKSKGRANEANPVPRNSEGEFELDNSKQQIVRRGSSEPVDKAPEGYAFEAFAVDGNYLVYAYASTDPALADQHAFVVLRLSAEHLDDEASHVRMKQPVARFDFFGPAVESVAFEDPNAPQPQASEVAKHQNASGKGVLFFRTAGGDTYKATWSSRGMLSEVCQVIKSAKITRKALDEKHLSPTFLLMENGVGEPCQQP